ncbi:MAG: carboxypeptidase-like regulatory domain-containing protein [Marinifilaceae bacterium]|nr:carboxypeptidase-like regulatory domain-containing protein [Marinifilaceae bacterium]
MKKYIFSIIVSIMLFSTPNVVAQNNKKIHLKVKDQSLGEVIPLLTPNCSFNSETLGSISISIDRSFSSIEEALNYILKNTNISFSKISGVYVFYYNNTKKDFEYSGYIFDSKSHLPLENTLIIADKINYYTNKNGYFKFKTKKKNIPIVVKYIGYNSYYTNINHDSYIKIYLKPKELLLKEVDISLNLDSLIPKPPIVKLDARINENIEESPLIKIVKSNREHKSNLERIICNNLANANIYIDHIRVLETSPISNLIGIINPLVVNKSNLYISNYDIKYGNITDNLRLNSNDISNIKTNSLKAYINNLNLGIYTSSKISNLARFTIGYRSTYNNLLNNSFTSPYSSKNSINFFINNNENYKYLDFHPEYNFDDLNINVYGNIDKKDKLSYTVSIYNTNSKLINTIKDSETNSKYNNSISSNQNSYLLKLKWKWNKHSATTLKTEMTSLDSNESFLHNSINKTNKPNYIYEEIISTGENYQTFENISINNTLEKSFLTLEHKINKGIHSLFLGIESMNYEIKNSYYEENKYINSLTISDAIKINTTRINIGNRLDYYKDKIFFQPRIKIEHQINDELLLNSSIGIYNKYLSKSPLKLNDLGYFKIWNLKNFQKNIQFSIGGKLSLDTYMLKFKTFWHKINNYQYIYRNSILNDTGYKYGLYLSGNMDINRGILKSYFSYTNFKMKESQNEYQLLNVYKFNNLSFSINTIYTNGYNYSFQNRNIFSNSSNFIYNSPINLEYFRIDLGFNYRKRFKGITVNGSISLINLLNTNNPHVQEINFINQEYSQDMGYSYSLQRGIIFTLGFSL